MISLTLSSRDRIEAASFDSTILSFAPKASTLKNHPESLEDPYWTKTGETWVRTLPARSIDEFASGNCSPLMMMPRDGGYLLLDTATGGKTMHPDRSAAQSSADDLAKELLDTRNARMLASAGLDDHDWRFCSQDRFVWFQAVDRPTVRLERHAVGRWVVIDGCRTVGFGSTPVQAAGIAAEMFPFTTGMRAP